MKRWVKVLLSVVTLLIAAVGLLAGYFYLEVNRMVAEKKVCAAKPPEEAVACFTVLLQKDPYDTGGLLGRGNALQRKGDHGAAIADYTKALEIDPKDPDLYIQRGNAFLALGQPAKARADWESVLKLPDEGGSHERVKNGLARIR